MIKRKTVASKKIIEILTSSKKPLPVPTILEKLKECDISPNKSTIYRILKKCISENIISEIPFKNGIKYYEGSNRSNHDHFQCNICEAIYCLTDKNIKDNITDLNHLLPNQKFKITSHQFNLYGVCEPCQNT